MGIRRLFIILGIVVFLGVALLVGVIWYGSTIQTGPGSYDNYSASDLGAKARTQLASGNVSVAETYLEQALRKDGSDQYRYELAVVKYRLKKYDESLALYQKLIESGTQVAFAHNGIGNVYRDMSYESVTESAQLTEQALISYQSARAVDAKYEVAYSNAAQLLVDRNRKPEALVLLEEGITRTNSENLKALKVTITSQ